VVVVLVLCREKINCHDMKFKKVKGVVIQGSEVVPEVDWQMSGLTFTIKCFIHGS